MEYLAELVRIVTKQKIKNIDLMTDYTKRSKMNDLYNGVSKGHFKTDKEAVEVLYPGQDLSVRGAYRKLKERLIEQLVNATLLIGTSSGLTKAQQNYFNVLRYTLAAKLTRLRAGYKVSKMLAKKTLRLALKIEQTNAIVDMYELLRGLSSRDGDLRSFEKYDRLFNQYNDLLQAENQVKIYVEHVSLLNSRSASVEKVIKISREYEARIRKLDLGIISSTFIVFSHLLYVERCEKEGSYIELQKNCEQAIKLLEERTFVNKTHIFAFLYKNVGVYRRFQKYSEGRIALDRAVDSVSNKESVNWFLVKREQVSLCFFCNEYKEGFPIYLETLNYKIIKKLPQGDQEPWEVFRLYFLWYKNLGLLDVKPAEERLLVFSMKKLFSANPIHAKDKVGYNATIMVLQILFLIQLKKNGVLIDRAESISAYAKRHFRRLELYRTYYFVNLLLLIPANQFNKIAVERKSRPLLEKLKVKNISGDSYSGNVEVVPYEDLWKLVLTLL